jgi:O-antigen/teichoic acid export membrane protein
MEERAIARNTLIQILGKGFSTVLGIFTVAVLARELGAFQYGEFTLALAYLSVFATVVDFGLTLTTVQLISERPEDEPKILGNLLVIRLVSAAVFLSAAPIIALAFPYSGAVKMAIAIGAISYFAATTAQMLIGVFQKNLRMEIPMLAEGLNRLIVLGLLVFFPFSSLSVTSAIWIFTAGNIAQLIITLLSAKQFSRIELGFSPAVARDIFARTWPIGLSILFNLIYLKGDILFLSFFRDAEEIGLYGMAYRVIEVVAAIPVMYMGLILPILTMQRSKGNAAAYQKTLQQAFNFFSLIAFPIIAGSMLLGGDILALVGGEEFRNAGPVMLLLGPALFGVFYGALFGHAIVSLNKQRPMVTAYLSVAVVTVFGYLWHIPEFGMYGAAFWTLISEILIAIIAAVVVLKVSGARLKFKTTLAAFFASILMTLVLSLLPSMHILIAILIGAATYAIFVPLLGGPSLKSMIALVKTPYDSRT